jgi:hypothetical protein
LNDFEDNAWTEGSSVVRLNGPEIEIKMKERIIKG